MVEVWQDTPVMVSAFSTLWYGWHSGDFKAWSRRAADLHEVQAEALGVGEGLRAAARPEEGLKHAALLYRGHAGQQCARIVCASQHRCVQPHDRLRRLAPVHSAKQAAALKFLPFSPVVCRDKFFYWD